MKIKWFFYVFIGLMMTVSGFGDQFLDVRYSGAGNFKGKIWIPSGIGPFPVIVYNYDQFLDWRGEAMAKKSGYDLEPIMRALSHRRYIVFVPIERYRRLASIRAAFSYLEAQPIVKSDEIHLVGLSEGAFLSLLVAADVPELKSLTLIAPKALNQGGFFSIPNIMNRVEKLQMPIFFVSVAIDQKRYKKDSDAIYAILKLNKKISRFWAAPQTREWFWNPSSIAINPLIDFIDSQGK